MNFLHKLSIRELLRFAGVVAACHCQHDEGDGMVHCGQKQLSKRSLFLTLICCNNCADWRNQILGQEWGNWNFELNHNLNHSWMGIHTGTLLCNNKPICIARRWKWQWRLCSRANLLWCLQEQIWEWDRRHRVSWYCCRSYILVWHELHHKQLKVINFSSPSYL